MSIRNTTAEIMTAGNFFDGLSGVIVASEARGQRELVEASQFPADMRGERAVFEAMGVEFLGPTEGDPIFLDCRLPAGWMKVATNHAMWSDLMDAKGRKRAEIFYKAAFYDRRAHARPCRRFDVSVRGFADYTRWIGYVLDTCSPPGETEGRRVVFASAEMVDPKDTWQGEAMAGEAVRAWLAEHLPGYKDPLAHWDDEPLPTVCVFPAWDAV